MRVLVVAALVFWIACASDAPAVTRPPAAVSAFLHDRAARRNALLESVEDYPEAEYARIRVAHYAVGGDDDWDALPIFVRGVRPLKVRSAEQNQAFDVLPDIPNDNTLADWRNFGDRLFHGYPIQIGIELEALRDQAGAERAGFAVAADGSVESIVEVERSDGSRSVSFTCASCHEGTRDGVHVPGLPGVRNLGVLFGTNWPRGTNDPTTDNIDNPQRPSDLRPIAHQTRLHATGNLRNGAIARMVRIETLMIAQLGFRQRPPREFAVALSLYLDALETTLPAISFADSEGNRAYLRNCARCHGANARGGDVVLAATIGSDARATEPGAERTTGGYRAPSLWGAFQREKLLHDGRAENLASFLGLHGNGLEGHDFLSDVPAPERAAIFTFLSGATHP